MNIQQRRFDILAFIPGVFGAQLAVVEDAIHTTKAIVSQDNALAVGPLNDGMEVVIVDSRRSIPDMVNGHSHHWQ